MQPCTAGRSGGVNQNLDATGLFFQKTGDCRAEFLTANREDARSAKKTMTGTSSRQIGYSRLMRCIIAGKLPNQHLRVLCGFACGDAGEEREQERKLCGVRG